MVVTYGLRKHKDRAERYVNRALPILASVRPRLPHPAAIFGGWDTMLHASLGLTHLSHHPRDPVSTSEAR